MTRFWWVRHAPTHAKAFAGWRDIPADLSDSAALDRLHAFLPPEADIISSDLTRASATALALSTGRRQLPAARGLREMHFGDWDGMRFDEVSARWPDLSRAFWENPGATAPPNGESWDQAADRVGQAADQLLTQQQGRDLILVSHFGAILTQYRRAAGITAYAALGQTIDNLSVTCLCHDGARWRVELVNHIA